MKSVSILLELADKFSKKAKYSEPADDTSMSLDISNNAGQTLNLSKGTLYSYIKQVAPQLSQIVGVKEVKARDSNNFTYSWINGVGPAIEGSSA